MPRYRTPRYRKRTVTRPRTRWHCHWRPRRDPPRTVTPTAAARFVCAALKHGASRAEIERATEAKCPTEAQRPKRAAEEALAMAMEAIQLNTATLSAEYQAFLIINGILLGLIALLGVIQLAGPLRLVGIPLRLAARTAQVQVATLLRVNISRRAANDAVFEALRRAA